MHTNQSEDEHVFYNVKPRASCKATRRSSLPPFISTSISAPQHRSFLAMGQYWYLANLDKAQQLYMSKLGETFFDCPLSECVLLGRVPTLELLPYFEPPPLAPSIVKQTGINGLPDKLLDKIFSYLYDGGQCIRLALTGRRYWNLARPHIRQSITDYIKSLSWAGDRIICIGDYTEEDDLPRALQADKQFAGKDLYELVDEDFTSVPSGLEGRGMLGGNILRSKLGEVLSNAWMGDEFAFGPSSIFTDCIPVEEIEANKLVLRNLSKHEYVQYSRLPMSKSKSCEVDLALAAQSQICWSSDPSTSMWCAGNVTRGSWAGDRLDIAPIEEVKNGEDAGQTISLRYTSPLALSCLEVQKERFQFGFKSMSVCPSEISGASIGASRTAALELEQSSLHSA
ncbi:hypothetical protein DENSPDRAFT_566220 [Dentipellis sp. KUC8613]|nr:hypothetical protein DENSPDRAFT_566220 [Dentipellis sp. KUC8613]